MRPLGKKSRTVVETAARQVVASLQIARRGFLQELSAAKSECEAH